MKIFSQLLALCVIHPDVWVTTTAFFTQAPTALVSKGRRDVLVPPSFSYLDSLSSPKFSEPTEYEYTFPPANTGTFKPSLSIPDIVSIPDGPELAVPEPVAPLPMPMPVPPAPVSIAPPRPVLKARPKIKHIKNAWDSLSPVAVQGGSLRTWSFTTSAIRRVHVMLKTEGRPLRANVELWQGPDNTPQTMNLYSEDGNLRPINAVIETPRGQNAIAVRNTGQIEFPLAAGLQADVEDEYGNTSMNLGALSRELARIGTPKIIQGGALHTYPFDPSVASVQILLKTDGRPLNARIELLQGPNNNKQVIELYCEDGNERPFFAIIETPGTGNVVRIVNTATMEFPLTARVEPYIMEEYDPERDDVLFVLDGQW